MNIVYAEKEYCEELVSKGKAWKVVDEVIERKDFCTGEVIAVDEIFHYEMNDDELPF